MPRYYPICLSLEAKPCLVIGGGQVARRKVESLLDAGAAVTVVSPAFCDDLLSLEGIQRITRPFEERDVAGACLVYAATDDPAVNSAVAAAARKAGALVNVVDTPDECDFIVPSTLTRGDLTISVSTGGAGPALSRRLRLELEPLIPQDFGEFVALLAELRAEVAATVPDIQRRSAIARELADKPALELFRQRGPGAVRQLARELIERGP